MVGVIPVKFYRPQINVDVDVDVDPSKHFNRFIERA